LRHLCPNCGHEMADVVRECPNCEAFQENVWPPKPLVDDEPAAAWVKRLTPWAFLDYFIGAAASLAIVGGFGYAGYSVSGLMHWPEWFMNATYVEFGYETSEATMTIGMLIGMALNKHCGNLCADEWPKVSRGMHLLKPLYILVLVYLLAGFVLCGLPVMFR